MTGIPEWVDALRLELPAVHGQAYLNTGSAGPMPTGTADAIRAALDDELEHGRGNITRFGGFLALRERARALAAELLGAEPDEVALTHHTSEGLNIVLWGLDWQPGDAIVVTSLEHDAAMVPLGLLRDRRGVSLRIAEIGHGEAALEALSALLDDRVRLVLLSHVAWSTGAVLPVAEIVTRAHAVGALVVVDGAQAGGVLPLDLGTLGADFYTLSGQKWICGPEGTGALFVRRDALAALSPTFAGYFSAARHDFRGSVEWHSTARRFEVGMPFRPALAGFAASLEWLLREVRVERAWSRSLELADSLRLALADLAGVEVLTPAFQASSLVALRMEHFAGGALKALALWLSARGVIVRSIDTAPRVLRASLGFFNTAEDLHRLHEGLAEALHRGPDGLS